MHEHRSLRERLAAPAPLYDCWTESRKQADAEPEKFVAIWTPVWHRDDPVTGFRTGRDSSLPLMSCCAPWLPQVGGRGPWSEREQEPRSRERGRVVVRHVGSGLTAPRVRSADLDGAAEVIVDVRPVNRREEEVVSDANKALALRIPLEAFAQGRAEIIDDVMSPNFVDHGAPPGMPPGIEGVKMLVRAARSAFPDLRITVNHAVAEGDLVMVHTTTFATMMGDFAGMPASGKTASWDAVHIDRIEDGKIAEHWTVQDQLGMLQQLGFLPSPESQALQPS